MDTAVELFFDASGDQAVRKIWRKLSAAGINSFMEDMGSTPHLSMAVYNEVDTDLLGSKLAFLAQDFPPLSLRLSAVGMFPGREGVLFLAPAVTQELLDLHCRYHSLASDWSDLVWPYYRPGVWFPHCTLAMALKESDLAQALQLVRADFSGLEVTVSSAAIVRYSPAVLLRKFAFGKI